jgi:hypothetical protein
MDPENKDELEAVLEEARKEALSEPQDTYNLPSDWSSWDVYVPSPSKSASIWDFATPVTAQDATQEEPSKAAPKYSEYLQEKIEEYYDKYILD